MPDTELKPRRQRRGGRVAYLMSWFPAPTETFILHELLELRRQGIELDVYPLLGAAPGPRHAGADEMIARTRYHRGLSREVLEAQLHWLRRGRARTCARGVAPSAATSARRASSRARSSWCRARRSSRGRSRSAATGTCTPTGRRTPPSRPSS